MNSARNFVVNSILIPAVLLVPVSLWAAPSSLREAQEQMSKAYQRYYEAISGKGLSSEKQKELADKILAPANRELSEFAKGRVKDSTEKTVLALKKKSPKGASKKIQLQPPTDVPPAVAGKTAPKPKVTAQPKVTTQPKDDAPPKEAVVIEGSDVPQEIEFPGAKNPPAPIASPRPAR